MLADADRVLGGRVAREAGLPGLSEWIRVRDYRVGRLQSMANVEIFLDSTMTAEDIVELAPDHVAIATGSRWRLDGFGRHNEQAIQGLSTAPGVHSPEAVMGEGIPNGGVLVFDDDHYYLASALAEKLALEGREVCYVTPAERAATWSFRTDEQHRVYKRLNELDVRILVNFNLIEFTAGTIKLEDVNCGAIESVDTKLLVPVTSQSPEDALYYDLLDLTENEEVTTEFTVNKIGDCDAPGIIANAVFAGHRWARELDETIDDSNPIRYDRVFYQEVD